MKSSRKSLFRTLRESFFYTSRDKRKLISVVIILTLPILGGVWRLIPEDSTVFHYGSLQTFIYLFSINFAIVLVAIAWFMTIPRRDFAMQIIVLAAVLYGVFLTFDTIPQKEPTPFWFDIVVSLMVFVVICVYLYYVHRNYIHRKIDHKHLYDGIVNDLHHQKLLNSVSRVEGIMDIAELEEPYRSMCKEELMKIKDAVSYVSEKYSELN